MFPSTDPLSDVHLGETTSGRILYAEQDAECAPSARQMMAAALADGRFDWAEAERLAALPDFKVAERLNELKAEVARA